MTSTPLRDVIESRLEPRWTQWSQAHPHLAAVIDRTRLIESAVDRLRDDPIFVDAMRRAQMDEATLASAARILDQADHLMHKLLPLP